MNCPSYVGRQSTIHLSIGRTCPPYELCLILEQNMLIWTLHEKSFNSKMCQNGQSGLRVPKRVSWDGNARIIVELLLQKVKPYFKILNNVLVVSTPLIVLHESSSQNLPIFCLQQFTHLFLRFGRLLFEPMLEKSHFWVEKRTMRFLCFICWLSQSPAFPKDLCGGVEYLFDRSEAIRCEVPSNLALGWLWVVVTIEVKNPISIQMRMHWHVESVRGKPHPIVRTIFVEIRLKAGIALLRIGC